MPKSKQQCEEIKQKRINSLMSVSLYYFATKGYNAVTTDEITAAAGCSHGLLYHYFGNKENLFLYMMENYALVINRDIIKDVSFDQKAKYVIYDLLNAYLEALKSPIDEYACTIHLLLKLHLEKKYIPKPPVKNQRKKIFDWIYEIVERGKKEGDFSDQATIEVVIAILSMFTGLAYNRINLGYKKFQCPSINIIMNMIIGGPNASKN